MSFKTCKANKIVQEQAGLHSAQHIIIRIVSPIQTLDLVELLLMLVQKSTAGALAPRVLRGAGLPLGGKKKIYDAKSGSSSTDSDKGSSSLRMCPRTSLLIQNQES